MQQGTNTTQKSESQRWTPEEFFFFLSRFHQAMDIMEWRDGEQLLQNFERHLYGAFLCDWESILDSANNEAAVDAAGLPIEDIDFFEEVVANYTANQIDKADWTEQADYIRSLKNRSQCLQNSFYRNSDTLSRYLQSYLKLRLSASSPKMN
jgi:hypothetical protein